LVAVAQDLVKVLLDGFARRFSHEVPREGEGEKAEETKHQIHAHLCSQADRKDDLENLVDEEVGDPVRASCNRIGRANDVERVDLAVHCPGDWAHADCEEEHKGQQRNDSCVASQSLRGLRAIFACELHAYRSHYPAKGEDWCRPEQHASAPFLLDVED